MDSFVKTGLGLDETTLRCLHCGVFCWSINKSMFCPKYFCTQAQFWAHLWSGSLLQICFYKKEKERKKKLDCTIPYVTCIHVGLQNVRHYVHMFIDFILFSFGTNTKMVLF